MGIDALNIMRQHRKETIETGSNSEEFTFNSGASSFLGIFDDSHIEEKEDKGNVEMKTTHARIMVDSLPAGLVSNIEITRAFTGEKYYFSFYGKDTEGIPTVWLY